jgi:predicted membrane protein
MKMARIVRRTKWTWGIALILIAALILSNHFGGFVDLGIWSIIVGAIAVGVLVDSLASLSFATLPLPIAALYYIFQGPFDLPHISFWPLALVTLLVIIGMNILLPRRFCSEADVVINLGNSGSHRYSSKRKKNDPEMILEEGEDSNNPRISVQFGSVTRYLHSSCLETAELDCNFGAMEIYFDNVELSPNGAEVYVNCNFGGVDIYVPGHWRVFNEISATLGGADVDKRLRTADEGAPTIVFKGSVSFGGVDIHRI